jgi:phage repressor protein C with HTH and peptisase S24 domain
MDKNNILINYDAILFRVKEARDIITDKDLAKIFGLSQQDFAARKKRETLLPFILEFAINENIDLNWLITGEKRSSATGGSAANIGRPGDPEGCLSPDDYVILPMLESRIAAGPEGEILYEEIKDYYPFKRWWVQKLFGKNEDRLKFLVLLRVRGDSMSPTIDPGELVMVDTAERERIEIRIGQIYLVNMPDGSSAIKRLALSECAGRQKLICISDNVAVYRPFEFELDPAKTIKNYVLGRVRWAGKEFE